MEGLRVWAPAAREVSVESDGTLMAMERVEDGWWETKDFPLKHGKDYAFVLDGKKPVADPAFGLAA